MRARISFVAAIAIAASSAAMFASTDVESQAKAPKQRDFVVAGSDGYGTQECLTNQSQCGRIVANAWCEAKGFKSALAYRQLDRDEITGSANPTGPRGKPVESFLISCRD
jgi:hypothetical protein